MTPHPEDMTFFIGVTMVNYFYMSVLSSLQGLGVGMNWENNVITIKYLTLQISYDINCPLNRFDF